MAGLYGYNAALNTLYLELGLATNKLKIGGVHLVDVFFHVTQ